MPEEFNILPNDEAPFAHELRSGDAYASLRFTVSAELNQQFLFALEDFAPEYLGSDKGRAIVHPVVLLHMSARTRSPSFRLAPGTGSVFARDVAKFERPAYVDEALEVRWTVRNVYMRKDRLYQALETIVVSVDDGKAVLRREAHSLFLTQDGVTLALPSAQS